MYKMTFTFLAITFSFLAIATGMEATCKLCEQIRERNKQNPSSGYTYYEDYVEAQGKNEKKQEEPKNNNTTQQNVKPQNVPPANPQNIQK